MSLVDDQPRAEPMERRFEQRGVGIRRVVGEGTLRGAVAVGPVFRPPTRRRRVLVLSPQPFYEDRGTPIAVRQLLNALIELGYEADLLTYPIGSSPDIPGVRYFRAANPLGFSSVPVGFSLRKVVLDAALIVSFVRRLRAERYDAIHAIEEGAFPAAIAARMLGVPLVYDMASSLPEQLTNHPVLGTRVVQYVLRACERWMLRRADRVVCSAGLSEKVLGLEPTAKVCEWSFSAEPVDRLDRDELAGIRAEVGVGQRDRVVMYTGNFASYQGVDLLLAAAARVGAARDDTTFVLVGGYADEQRDMERAAARLGIADRMCILGRQTRQRSAQLLQIADVLISPRCFGANLPLKIFDYLAAGRPIVATDIPTHRTVLDESSAVLVAPTPSGLAAGIEQVLSSPVRADSIARAGAALATERFGWKAFVGVVSGIFDDVLGTEAPGIAPVAANGAVRPGPGEAGRPAEPLIEHAQERPLASGTTGF